MYEYIIRPLLFSLKPETAHHLAINFCRLIDKTPGLESLLTNLLTINNKVDVMGLKFPNRLGLAAGLDKNGQAANIFAALGFGFVEIGTVTPKPQKGNPKPRLFRIIEDKALINRMGFNNHGVDIIKKRLLKYTERKFVLGGNIGKNTQTDNSNAVNDYRTVLEGIYPLTDYIVLNVSCPNIANLKELQNREYLSTLMKMMVDYREHSTIYKPFVVKISPDLSQSGVTETIELIREYNFDGIIVSNTTTSRQLLTISKERVQQIGNGGLSGKPLFEKSLRLVDSIRKRLDNSVAVIGCGGISNAQNATDMFNAGADLIQIYTGFIYHGVKCIRSISKLHL